MVGAIFVGRSSSTVKHCWSAKFVVLENELCRIWSERVVKNVRVCCLSNARRQLPLACHSLQSFEHAVLILEKLTAATQRAYLQVELAIRAFARRKQADGIAERSVVLCIAAAAVLHLRISGTFSLVYARFAAI